jgi:hypothetical protein
VETWWDHPESTRRATQIGQLTLLMTSPMDAKGTATINDFTYGLCIRRTNKEHTETVTECHTLSASWSAFPCERWSAKNKNRESENQVTNKKQKEQGCFFGNAVMVCCYVSHAFERFLVHFSMLALVCEKQHYKIQKRSNSIHGMPYNKLHASQSSDKEI